MSRVNVRVRPAIIDDVPGLVKLSRALDLNLGVFSGRPSLDATDEHLATKFTEIVADDERDLLVAVEEAGAIVGLLVARRDDVGAIDLTPVLRVSHLMVAADHRRRGVGRALLAGAVHVAEEAGIEHVMASVASTSREGNRYLARLGFAPLMVHRIAPTTGLRRALGMTDPVGRVAMLRRAKLARAQRAGFAARAARRA